MSTSLLLQYVVIALAVLRMGLSPAEALRAATLGGACALGLGDEIARRGKDRA